MCARKHFADASVHDGSQVSGVGAIVRCSDGLVAACDAEVPGRHVVRYGDEFDHLDSVFPLEWSPELLKPTPALSTSENKSPVAGRLIVQTSTVLNKAFKVGPICIRAWTCIGIRIKEYMNLSDFRILADGNLNSGRKCIHVVTALMKRFL